MANEDRDHLRDVRHLSCCVCHVSPCEAHHAGRKGMGQRAHDRTAIPLCSQHHREWHDHGGHFRGWDRDQRRQWATWQIAKTLERVRAVA